MLGSSKKNGELEEWEVQIQTLRPTDLFGKGMLGVKQAKEPTRDRCKENQYITARTEL